VTGQRENQMHLFVITSVLVVVDFLALGASLARCLSFTGVCSYKTSQTISKSEIKGLCKDRSTRFR
jgi:hypothetical protein